MSEVAELKQEIEELKEDISEIKDAVTKDQPDKYLEILEDGQPSEPVLDILKAAKKGNLENGVKTSQVRAILDSHGYSYSNEGTRNVMQRIDREMTRMVYKSRVGAKGSKLIYDFNKEL